MKKKFSINDLEKFGMSKRHFAELVEVSPTSVTRYFEGLIKNEELNKKIEIACAVLNDVNSVWPKLIYAPGNEKRIKEYEKNKKKVEKLDKKFTTAYKKALKKAEL